jgi:hypothetical protein
VPAFCSAGEIVLSVNSRTDSTGGSLLITATPDPAESIAIGAYAINLQFDNFREGIGEPIAFEMANLLAPMAELGPSYGTTPHPGVFVEGDAIQYVAFGSALVPAGGVDLMEVQFEVPGGFTAGQSFDVTVLPENPSNPSQLTYVGGVPLVLDSATISPPAILPCDVDTNSVCDALDIDLLSDAVRDEIQEPAFDVNDDGLVDSADRVYWVHVLMNSYFGDADLNGEFNSTDLVKVLQAGEYEDGVPRNSSWATGDWSGDREFDTGDMLVAFQDGGYELGPRQATASVPEPSGALLLILAALFGFRRWRSS